VESADTADLKSALPKGGCGFESRRRQWTPLRDPDWLRCLRTVVGVAFVGSLAFSFPVNSRQLARRSDNRASVVDAIAGRSLTARAGCSSPEWPVGEVQGHSQPGRQSHYAQRGRLHRRERNSVESSWCLPGQRAIWRAGASSTAARSSRSRTSSSVVCEKSPYQRPTA